MGQLVNGKWEKGSITSRNEGGAFVRSDTGFRNWITADGSAGPTGEGGFRAEPDRYHLYVSYACPWAHRALVFRKLKGLDDLIGVSVVHPDMLSDGWTFDLDFPGTTGDRLHGFVVRDVEALPEFEVTAVTLAHEATGAHWLHLDAADTNNAFHVAFKTTPTDSTGVAHVLEPCVVVRTFPIMSSFCRVDSFQRLDKVIVIDRTVVDR